MSDFRREEKSADYLLPDSVKSWFQLMYTHMISGNIEEMERLYNKEFNVLTTNYFKQSSWPEPSSIRFLVDEDNVFLTLYTQIYFRHMFSKLQPTMEYKSESWKNYCDIFNGILEGTLELDALPSQWIYDIVGEFVYQYQSFCQYRAKISSKSEGEIARYREYENIWDTPSVLSYLEALIKKSKVLEILKAKTDEDIKEIPRPPSDTIYELGYYSLICLSRAHVLYGDYYTSLKLLAPIDVSQKGVYNQSCSCYVSLFYHMGFAQLMLRRFSDAISTFSQVILQVHRRRSYFSRQPQYDQINKWCDKSLALLTIAMSLCSGQRIDEQIYTLIREKYSDQYMKLQRGETSVYGELFSFSCPKFILPVAFSSEELKNRAQEAFNLQFKFFNSMVNLQNHVPTIRSYLKLYRSIDLPKLAHFRDVDEETIRAELISFKQINHQLQSKIGQDKLHGGKLQSVSDIQFYIDQGLVHVDESKLEYQSGEYFMNSIIKFIDATEV